MLRGRGHIYFVAVCWVRIFMRMAQNPIICIRRHAKNERKWNCFRLSPSQFDVVWQNVDNSISLKHWRLRECHTNSWTCYVFCLCVGIISNAWRKEAFNQLRASIARKRWTWIIITSSRSKQQSSAIHVRLLLAVSSGTKKLNCAFADNKMPTQDKSKIFMEVELVLLWATADEGMATVEECIDLYGLHRLQQNFECIFPSFSSNPKIIESQHRRVIVWQLYFDNIGASMPRMRWKSFRVDPCIRFISWGEAVNPPISICNMFN